MIRLRQLLTIVLAAMALVALAACGGGGGGGGKSGPVEVVTHNAVGGGSDVFTRQMIKVMYENKIIDTNWPVRNVPAGDSIGAMSYMIDRKGNEGLIAQVTPTWLATPMTVANAKVSLADLTPITLVATEPQVVVTNANPNSTLSPTSSPPPSRARHPRPGRRLQHRQRRADTVGAAGHARSEVEVPVLRGHRLPDHRAAARRRQHHARQRFGRRRAGEGRPAQGDRGHR